MFAAGIALFVLTFILAQTRFWRIGFPSILAALGLMLASVMLTAWRHLP